MRYSAGLTAGRREADGYWTYRCDFFGGTLFRVHLNEDGRVTSTEWWLN